MDVAEALAGHVKPACQGRSQATMGRIMEAFVRLLDAKPFDQITMAELAAEAQASLPSIYARFGDKKALLLAAHEDFKTAMEREIDRMVADDVLANQSLEDLLAQVADRLCAMYESQHNLLRGMLLADSPILYHRAAELYSRGADELARLIRQEVPRADQVASALQAHRAMSASVALLQQRLLFGVDAPATFVQSPELLREHITSLLVGALQQARASVS